jgi:hypothetical protein
MSQSIKSDKISESSIARMAGNIAAGLVLHPNASPPTGDGIRRLALQSVEIARAIAAELERTRAAEGRSEGRATPEDMRYDHKAASGEDQ